MSIEDFEGCANSWQGAIKKHDELNIAKRNVNYTYK